MVCCCGLNLCIQQSALQKPIQVEKKKSIAREEQKKWLKLCLCVVLAIERVYLTAPEASDFCSFSLYFSVRLAFVYEFCKPRPPPDHHKSKSKSSQSLISWPINEMPRWAFNLIFRALVFSLSFSFSLSSFSHLYSHLHFAC